MPAKTVADIIGEHDTRIWRVLEHYVQEARSHEDFSNVHSVGVDETSRAKGHNYISIFVDLGESRVIHVCDGRDSGTVTSFKHDYEAHKGLAGDVTDFCCDMSPAFISGIESNFKNAAITFDRFHVMKLMNEAVDQVRREEPETVRKAQEYSKLYGTIFNQALYTNICAPSGLLAASAPAAGCRSLGRYCPLNIESRAIS